MLHAIYMDTAKLEKYAHSGKLADKLFNADSDADKKEVANIICYNANNRHIDVKNTTTYQATKSIFNWKETDFINNIGKLLKTYTNEDIDLLGLFHWEVNGK